MTLRDATEADLPVFADIFTDAIRAAGPSVYTPAQLRAWLASADDPAAYGRRVLRDRAFLAEFGSRPVGFTTLAPDGHVNMLFVRGEAHRRGVGSALLRAVLAAADEAGIPRLYAETNPFSLPVFRRAGFAQVGTEEVELRGERFTRSLVERRAPKAG